jgi:FixJ family two-component response regulator
MESLSHLVNSSHSRSVAIVDDEALVREALLDLLDEAGFLAYAFASGEDFLASGCQYECSCLITDFRMPGMSGLDLQAKLNAERLRVSFIFITAHSDEQMRMQALRAGAVEFLGKPFDDEVLLDTCERRWSADRRGKSSDPLVGLLAGTIGGALAM